MDEDNNVKSIVYDNKRIYKSLQLIYVSRMRCIEDQNKVSQLIKDVFKFDENSIMESNYFDIQGDYVQINDAILRKNQNKEMFTRQKGKVFLVIIGQFSEITRQCDVLVSTLRHFDLTGGVMK